MSKLANLSTSQVVDWINANPNINKTKSTKDAIDIIKAEDISGKTLLTMTTKKSFTELDIKGIAAQRIMDQLEVSFVDYSTKTQTEQSNEGQPSASTIEDILEQNEEEIKSRGTNSNNNGNLKTFAVQVSVGGGNRKPLKKKDFTIESTVLILKQAIADETGGNRDDLNLTYKSKPLLDNQTLGEIGINGENDLWVNALFDVQGGSSKLEDEKEEKYNNNNRKILDNGKNSDVRKRIPHFKNNKNIKPTLEPDCLTYYDSKKELRVIMPCGHIFSPLTIFKWCQRTLAVFSKSEVICPIINCGKIWEIEDIINAADLDEYEKDNLINILNHRQLMKSNDFKECPSCKTLVKLPETLYLCRVRCKNKICKNASDFCWICSKPWKGYGMTVCGNKGCDTESINEMLKIKNCGTTNEIWAFEDINCPKKRACPRCLAVSQHKGHCKHMVCWNCTREFCFICLSLGTKEDSGTKWSCSTGNSYDGKCKLADVQVLH